MSELKPVLPENKSVQEYLSLGYLFLLVLGIMRESIFFGFLGINIISYSNVLDVLLSPIAFITGSLTISIAIVVMIAVVYFLGLISPKMHYRFREKTWYKKINNVEKLDKQYESSQSRETIISIMAMMVFSFFVGGGIGGGLKVKSLIEEGDLKPDHRLVYNNDSEAKVRVLTINSAYVIYVVEGEKDITITPIPDHIRHIIKFDKETDSSNQKEESEDDEKDSESPDATNE